MRHQKKPMRENPTILVFLTCGGISFISGRSICWRAGAAHRILYIEEPILSESGKAEWRFPGGASVTLRSAALIRHASSADFTGAGCRG